MSPRSIHQDVRQEREELLLDVARSIIEQEGLVGLTIDKMVTQVPYSKGTVYGHFSNKEDVFLGLCNRQARALADFFARANQYSANTRERMVLIGAAYLLFTLLDPKGFHLFACAKTTPAIKHKSHPTRQEVHLHIEQEIFGYINSIVEEAIERKDITAINGLNSLQVCFAFISSSFGAVSLLLEKIDGAGCCQALEIQNEFFSNNRLILDGLGWVPNSNEYDWADSLRLAVNHVFPKEINELNEKNISFFDFIS